MRYILFLFLFIPSTALSQTAVEKMLAQRSVLQKEISSLQGLICQEIVSKGLVAIYETDYGKRFASGVSSSKRSSPDELLHGDTVKVLGIPKNGYDGRDVTIQFNGKMKICSLSELKFLVASEYKDLVVRFFENSQDRRRCQDVQEKYIEELYQKSLQNSSTK